MKLAENRSLQVVPPLKWAGGKRWLVQRLPHLFHVTARRYFEPFLGSGAVFFQVLPSRAVLSDTNPELIKFYEALRDTPHEVAKKLRNHANRHSHDYYYEVRSMKPTSATGIAARFLYLNRTCWNGLYRVNKRGQFNVPVGTKTNVLLPTDDFVAVSEQLACATLLRSDFEAVIDTAGAGDFVFVDPPYTVAHNMNGFLKYNENIFSWDDQIRLSQAVKRAADRGAKLVVTNANHRSVRDLYSNFSQLVVDRKSVISGDASFRGRYEELVIQI